MSIENSRISFAMFKPLCTGSFSLTFIFCTFFEALGLKTIFVLHASLR